MAFGVRFSSGTAAEPHISFADDPDCGLYRIGANNIGLSLGGTKRVDYGTAGVTYAVPVIAPAATTSIPSIRLPHGTAPSTPTDGDLWTTSAGGLFARVNGTTVQYTATDAAGTYVWTGAHTFNDQPVTVEEYVQGNTTNGFLRLRGDSGATKGVKLDDRGNIGMGGDPVATWYTNYSVLQLPGAALTGRDANGELGLFSNCYVNETQYIYRTTAPAARYELKSGIHAFYVAPSGTIDTEITGFITGLQITVAGTVVPKATAAAAAGFRLTHGTAPTSPTDGDMWTTTAGLFVRINGVTKTVTLT